ncbi:serine protease [Marispirochaeta sp.]|uniref:S1 family peptidase n=1 Tax=Marispirochaeta sp. TaxID=2038653 RepID=UPI0029C932B3|nr:serine protease [Marispirochaeta sp.]
MKRLSSLVLIVLSLIITIGCVTPGGDTQGSNLVKRDITAVIQKTCFEVVVPRLEAEHIVYDRELPWEKIPYIVRTDDYNSIGTAFAIGEDRFITAAHVFSLTDDSLLYEDYFIRDSNGEVFPVTNLIRFHDSKDFVEFTVEGFRADSYLEFRDGPYVKNETVFQVGNIYGQGIVAVPGTILGDMVEPKNGEWKYIKSSPPNDKGSSGGPLIGADMKVIGVIDLKDDNFSYSLPVSEITAVTEGKGYMDRDYAYSFSLLMGEKSGLIPYVREIDLPMDLREVKSRMKNGYMESYEANMEAFLEESGGLFPEGSGSDEALHGASTSGGIQVIYRNKDDRKWYFSSLDKNSGNLGDEGQVQYVSIAGSVYFDLMKPKRMSHDELYDSPKSVMDTLISGVSFSRKFAGDDIRIKTLGEPFLNKTITDRYERHWHVGVWTIDYADEVGIMMWTAVPSGVIGVMTFVDSSSLDMWLYDFGKIADLIYVPYSATLQEWAGYLANEESSFGQYADMDLSYENEGRLNVETDEISISFGSDFLTVGDTMMMTLTRDVFEQEGEFVWGLRKINFSESKRDNYFVSYRFLKPSEDLPESYHQKWEDFRNRRHPYNSSTYMLDGHTDIGTVHPQFSEDEESVFSLYLAYEGDQSKESMEQRLEFLKTALSFK